MYRWNPSCRCCANDKTVFTTSFFDKATGNFLSDLDYLGVPRCQSGNEDGLIIGGYNSEKLTIIEQKVGLYTFELYDPEPTGSFRLYFLTGSQFLTFVTADIPSRSTGPFLVNRINEAFNATRAELVKDGILGVSKITIKLTTSLSAAVPGDSSVYTTYSNVPFNGGNTNTAQAQTVHKVLVRKLTDRPSLREFDYEGDLVKDLKQGTSPSVFNRDIQRDILDLRKVGDKVHYIRDDGITYRDYQSGSTRPFDQFEQVRKKITYVETGIPIRYNFPRGSQPNTNDGIVLISDVDSGSAINLTITINDTVKTINIGANPTCEQFADAINAAFPGCCLTNIGLDPFGSLGPEFAYPIIHGQHGGVPLGSFTLDGPGEVTQYAITDSDHIYFHFQYYNYEPERGKNPAYINITSDNGTVVIGNWEPTQEKYIIFTTNDPSSPLSYNVYYEDYLRVGGITTGAYTLANLATAMNALPGCTDLFTIETETIVINQPGGGGDPKTIYVYLLVAQDKFPITLYSHTIFFRYSYLGLAETLIIQQEDGATDTFSFDYQSALDQPMQHGVELNLGNTPTEVADSLKSLYGGNYIAYVDQLFDTAYNNELDSRYPNMKFLVKVAKPIDNLLMRTHGDSDYQVYDLEENELIKKRDTSYRYLKIEVVGDEVFAAGNFTSFASSAYRSYRQLAKLDADGNIIKDTPIVLDRDGNISTTGYTGKLNFLRYCPITQLLFVGGSTDSFRQNDFWTDTWYIPPIRMFDTELNYVKSLPYTYGEVYDVAFTDTAYFTLVGYYGTTTIYKHSYEDDSIIWQKEFEAIAICSDGENIFVTCNTSIDGASTHCLSAHDGSIIWSTRNPFKAKYTDDDLYHLITIMKDKVVVSGFRKERIAKVPIRRIGVLDQVVLNESATGIT